MAGARQPLKLVEDKGKKHLTKAEIEQREKTEVTAPTAKKPKPPKYLSDDLKKKHRAIGKQLIALGIFTDLDNDVLARYLIAEQEYLATSDMLNLAIASKNVPGMDELSRIHARFYSQCAAAARDLGLTISSRCKLVLPEAPREEPDAMTQMLAARRRA